MLRRAPKWVGIAGALCWLMAPAHAQPNKLSTPRYDEKAKKWGYVDSDGKFSIPATFTAALAFSPTEKLAAVKGGEKYWFIDSTGVKAFNKDQEYDFAGPFREGVARVRKGKQWALLDREGKNLTDFDFEDLGDAHEGLIRARRAGVYNFLATNGKEVFRTRFELVGDFSDGRAWFREKGKYGYIDRVGKVAIKAQFEAADTFSSGRAGVRQKGQHGYIDLKGEVVIPAKYQLAHPFVGSLAVVQIEGKFGVIDDKGQVVIKPEYDQARLLTPTTGVARKGNKFEWFQRDAAGGFLWKGYTDKNSVSVTITSDPVGAMIYKVLSTEYDPQSPIDLYLNGLNRVGHTPLAQQPYVELYYVYFFICVYPDGQTEVQRCNPIEKQVVRFPQ